MTNEQEIAFYSTRLAEHGPTYRAADWGSDHGQRVRYEVIANLLPLPGSVLDVGCGTGDLMAMYWPWNGFSGVTATGWDITPGMVEHARRHHANHAFACVDILESVGEATFDYVIASGLFTHRDAGFMEAALARMWALCRKAVAFNCLSIWGTRPCPDEFRADPVSAMAACSLWSKRLALRHDYLPHDFTIAIFKG